MTVRPHPLAILMLSSALVMGACNKKDKPASQDGGVVQALAELTVDGVDRGDIEALMRVEARDITEDSANQALSDMGLLEQSDRFSWARKSGANGDYEYADLQVTDEDGKTVNIDALTLTGVRQEEDISIFDRMDMQGVSIEDEGQVTEIKALSMARPSAELASSILSALERIEDFDDLDDIDLDIDIESDEAALGAFSVEGITTTENENVFSLDYFGWAEDPESEKGVLLAENLSFQGTDTDSEAEFLISLDSVSASGLDMKAIRAAGDDGGMSEQNMLSLNPYKTHFGSFDVSNLDIFADGLDVSLEGISGQSDESGEGTELRQVMKPLTVTFSRDPMTPSMQQFKSVFDDLGYETLKFTGGQTTYMDEEADIVSVENAYLNMEDGFQLDYDYKAAGMAAMMDNMSASERTDPQQMEAMLDELEIHAFHLSLTDNNIVDRAFAFAAKQQGSTPSIVRLQAKGGLMMLGFGAQNESQGEFITQLVDAAGKFLDGGGTLRINFDPETPVAASELQALDLETFDPASLGLSVAYEEDE